VYIVLLIVNLIDEISKMERYDKYSIFYYIKYLNLNKDLIKIVELRNLSSVLSLYIQKGLKNLNIGYSTNKIKNFAFVIHLYFYSKLDFTEVISLDNCLNYYRFNRLRINSNFVNSLH